MDMTEHVEEEEEEEGVIQNAKWILARRHGRFGGKILWPEMECWEEYAQFFRTSFFFFFI